jgi:hypothetical protein
MKVNNMLKKNLFRLFLINVTFLPLIISSCEIVDYPYYLKRIKCPSVIIMGFIDESSPYTDIPATLQDDINLFNRSIPYLANPQKYFDNNYFVVFCVSGAQGFDCPGVSPIPPAINMGYTSRPALYGELKPYLDAALGKLQCGNEKFYLFFSIDNSGSMDDTIVRGAINELEVYVRATYSMAVTNSGFGSNAEYWISDMLQAYRVFETDLPVECRMN